MSRVRENRLRRVVDLWTRERDLRVAELFEARAADATAAERASVANEVLVEAIATRVQLADRVHAIEEWRSHEAWIANVANRKELADNVRAGTQRAVFIARSRVLESDNKLKRITALLERIEAETAKSERRLQRKDDDEISARFAVLQRANSA